METLLNTRDVVIWFFQKLRERGRDRTYLKPLDLMVQKIDKYIDGDNKNDETLNELNNEAINLMNDTVDREQAEFKMKPEFTEAELKGESITEEQLVAGAL